MFFVESLHLQRRRLGYLFSQTVRCRFSILAVTLIADSESEWAVWSAPSPALKYFVQILRRVKLRDMTLGQAAGTRVRLPGFGSA